MPADNVVRFRPANAAKDPNVVLERAMDAYEQLFIIGYDKDGCLDIRASLNFPMKDVFFAIEAFKFQVLNGEYGHRLTLREPE